MVIESDRGKYWLPMKYWLKQLKVGCEIGLIPTRYHNDDHAGIKHEPILLKIIEIRDELFLCSDFNLSGETGYEEFVEMWEHSSYAIDRKTGRFKWTCYDYHVLEGFIVPLTKDEVAKMKRKEILEELKYSEERNEDLEIKDRWNVTVCLRCRNVDCGGRDCVELRYKSQCGKNKAREGEEMKVVATCCVHYFNAPLLTANFGCPETEKWHKTFELPVDRENAIDLNGVAWWDVACNTLRYKMSDLQFIISRDKGDKIKIHKQMTDEGWVRDCNDFTKGG